MIIAFKERNGVLFRRSAEKACSTRSYEDSQQTWPQGFVVLGQF